MSEPASRSPRILVVEPGEDLASLYEMLLSDDGYTVTMASSLLDAVRHIDETAFDLILSELFGRNRLEALKSLEPLRLRAAPTAVGVVTAWPVTPEEAQSTACDFIIRKPFDVTDLLSNIAAALNTPLESSQRRQVQVVTRYFDALTANDWDALVNLCVPDVVYLLPGQSPLAGEIHGRAAFRAYSADVFSHFPSVRFEHVRVYSRPRGLAARYQSNWLNPEGERISMSGAVLFEFRDDLISQIGIRLHEERLMQLMESNR